MNRKNAKSTLKTLSETELSAASGAGLVLGSPGEYERHHRRHHHRHHRCDRDGYEQPIVIQI